MGTSIKVGVVGVGYLGSIHAKIYAQMPGVELIGVADTNETTAAEVGDRYQCAYSTDPYALVGKVDAVTIAVPTSSHKEAALPYLEAGVHMLLEKPIAPGMDEAGEIVTVAERKKVSLLIGHLERFNAGIMALANNVVRPRFIEVHRLGTFVERATDVDVVTDLMIHDIDIVLSLVKSDITYVSAVGTPVVTDHVDIANARLEFANNTVANVTASRVSNKKFRRIRVFAENGYQALNFVDQQIDVVRKTKPAPGQIYPGLQAEQLKVEPRPPLDAELEHFVDIVRNGGSPLVDGRDGLKALGVAELVKNKIHTCLI
ncbi:MAG: Gfo/Idh/MocA family oxidoreductase [Gammaproteobacteria bacterium]|nr:Gfo/Idh/MocA family oxidoreductase [Gammaproteobacteria bacterium]